MGVSITRLLMGRGANSTRKDATGNEALHYAKLHSTEEIYQLLLDREVGRDTTTNKQESGLMLCSRRSDEESVEVMRFLIGEGADLSEKDSDGNQVLHSACQYGRPEMVELLLAAKCDPNAENNLKQTPLMLACSNHFFGDQIVPILMAAGADMHLKDDLGKKKKRKDAIHYGFEHGNGAILKALAKYVGKRKEKSLDDVGLDNVVEPCGDPLGILTEARSFGYFQRSVVLSGSPSITWAHMRKGDVPLTASKMKKELYQHLTEESDPKYWITVSTELWYIDFLFLFCFLIIIQ
jgi:ankyrin repeat protein